MRKTLMVAAGIGMLLPAVALAQPRNEQKGPQVGDYAPSIEAKEWLNVTNEKEIPSLVELRGMTVVLFFWVSWHEGGDALLPYVNVLSYNPFGRTPDVYFIGVTDADRAATQSVIDDNKIFFPVAVESKAAEEYGFENGFGFVVVDPEGKIAYKSEQGGELNAVVNAVQEIRKNMPPTKTHPAEAKVCYRKLDEACDLIRQGRFTKAYGEARDAFIRSVLGDRLRSRTLEMADLLEELGYDRLAGLEPLLEQKKYMDAAELLRDVIRRFRRLDCFKDADALYKKLVEEDEGFKKAASRFDDEDAAARLEARDALKAQRFGESYDKLNKIVTEYPATQAAEFAEAMIGRMKQNKAFWAKIRDHQASGECRSLLARARNLIAQGRSREAERLLRRVADDYSDTVWAQEAIEELKKMP